MLAEQGPAARRAMHRLSDVLSAKDADVALNFFLEHLGDHLAGQARQAALTGDLATAARLAELGSEVGNRIAVSQAYNLDRKQTLLSILEAVHR